MRNIWILCRKELGSYFASPIAYLLLAVFGVIFGYFFWTLLAVFIVEGMEMQMRGQMYPMNLNEQIIRPLLSNANVIGLFVVPLISMRLFAEEKRTGTIELLATSPIRDYEIILGKWLAAVAMYCSLLLVSGLSLAFLFKYGSPDWKPLLVGYLGLILETAGLLAIGTFISTLTKNQIIAGAATFCVCLILFVIGWVSSFDNSTWANVCSYLSVATHMESFEKGMIDSKDSIFYLTVIFVGLFLSARSLESLRWRS
jgi:ABC-2 type transport system permease protein